MSSFRDKERRGSKGGDAPPPPSPAAHLVPGLEQQRLFIAQLRGAGVAVHKRSTKLELQKRMLRLVESSKKAGGARALELGRKKVAVSRLRDVVRWAAPEAGAPPPRLQGQTAVGVLEPLGVFAERHVGRATV